MRNVIVMCLVIFLVAIGSACSPCDDESCDCPGKNTNNNEEQTPQTGKVTIIILANQSIGRDGMLTIYQQTDNGDEMVEDLPILITNGGQFGFILDPGNYWVAVTGLAFTGYAEFMVSVGETYVLPIEMYEWPLITWWANLDVNSPSGPQNIGDNQMVMGINLWHDQEVDLQPAYFVFNIIYSLNLDVSYCYLYYDDNNTLKQIGTAGVENNIVYFEYLSGLAESYVPANSFATYWLACDVHGTNVYDDVLEVILTDFEGLPTSTAQQIHTLPLAGNLLEY